jgi:hypothetical protein
MKMILHMNNKPLHNNPSYKKLMRQRKNESIMTVLSFISIVAFVILAAVAIIVGLYRINIAVIPESVINFFGGTSGSGKNIDTPDDSGIKAYIREAASETSIVNGFHGVRYDIAERDFRAELADSQRMEVFSLVQETVYYDADANRVTYTKKIWVSGDKYRAETYDDSGVLLTSVVCDGVQVGVTDYTTYPEPVMSVYPISASFTYQSQAGLPSLDSYLNDSGITIVSEELSRTSQDNRYRIKYTYDAFPLCEDMLEVSFNYGLILEAETHYDGVLTYRMHTVSVTPGEDAGGYEDAGVTGAAGVTVALKSSANFILGE